MSVKLCDVSILLLLLRLNIAILVQSSGLEVIATSRLVSIGCGWIHCKPDVSDVYTICWLVSDVTYYIYSLCASSCRKLNISVAFFQKKVSFLLAVSPFFLYLHLNIYR